LRKFAPLASACAVLLFGFASFASAQQADVMGGGSILMSFASTSALASFQPPTEKGGTYLNFSGDYVAFGPKHRYGINVETAWRYKQGSYYGYENYRPFFTDANLLYQPKIGKKMGLDVMGGVGIASNRFNILASCGTPGCINYTSSNHFMEHLGIGFRYYVWHRMPHVYVRPEAHYYHIHDNVQFNSDNVFRLGASVGYTFK
jgi:hypothetical protein